MDRPLDRIEVKGFKSIREMDLTLRSLNVLIGANGSGKSNFVSVFGLLNQVVEKRLQVTVQRWGGANSLLYYGRRRTPEMDIKLTFGPNGYEAKLAATAEDNLFFTEEECWFQGTGYPGPYTIHLGSGTRETSLVEEASKGRIARDVLDSMRSWKVYHFHDTSIEAKVKQVGDIDDNAVLRADASNLAAFLYFLKQRHDDHYKLIVRSIQLVAPFFGDFQLRPNPLNQGKILLEWIETRSDAYFNAHSLSDGSLRFICLATLLLQPLLPSTILIDEPELGLHPFAIQVLAGLLKQAATKAQVIASTQSVTLVNQFTPEDVVVVDRRDDQSVFSRLTQDSMGAWLEDYGLGELWEKNVLGGRPSRG